MTLDDYKKAENDLLNMMADIRRNLEVADTGIIGGFTVSKTIAKSNAGTSLAAITIKFNTYKQKAQQLV